MWQGELGEVNGVLRGLGKEVVAATRTRDLGKGKFGVVNGELWWEGLDEIAANGVEISEEVRVEEVVSGGDGQEGGVARASGKWAVEVNDTVVGKHDCRAGVR